MRYTRINCMRRDPMPDPGNYQVNIFPSGGAEAGGPGLAVCFSGGGSRALSCALGQLSGLRSIKNPKDQTKSVLDSIPYVSSVSGGSWASVLYTFLPSTISDDEFLIEVVPPDKLIKHAPSFEQTENVCYMAPHCLGTAPGQFNAKAIGDVVYKLFEWGLFLSADKASWSSSRSGCTRPPTSRASTTSSRAHSSACRENMCRTRSRRTIRR